MRSDSHRIRRRAGQSAPGDSHFGRITLLVRFDIGEGGSTGDDGTRRGRRRRKPAARPLRAAHITQKLLHDALQPIGLTSQFA